MEMYKQASKLGLRFNTDRGSLSVEQIWSLNMTQLSNLVKSIKKILEGEDKDSELSFLDETRVVDVENQLRFDIAKDIYLTKKAENAAVVARRERKEFEQRILQLIQDKKEENLKGKSIEELEAMLSGIPA